MTSQPIPQFVVAAINQNNNNNGNVDDSPKKSPTKNNPDTLKYYELNLEL